MKLEEVTSVIRPRNPWEATDLGCALARMHLLPILQAWFLTVIPFAIIISFALHKYPLWVPAAIWFFKPLYDRVPLYYLSRNLFGETPTTGTIVKQWFKTLHRHFFKDLFLYRLSSYRGIWLPIRHLENQKGKNARMRLKLLTKPNLSKASYLIHLCIIWEMIIMFSLFSLGWIFVPEINKPDLTNIFLNLDPESIPPLIIWTYTTLYICSFSIVEIFYVSVCFAIYINSRTILEGWDIELAFRRLAARISSKSAAKAIAVLALTFFLLNPSPSYAQTNSEADNSKKEIQKILQDPDFKIHTVTRKHFESSDKDNDSTSNRALQTIGSLIAQILLYVICIAAVIWLVYYLVNNYNKFTRNVSVNSGEEAPKPRIVMGMDMDEKSISLPKNIPQEALRLCSEGDNWKALALLYRGAIFWMIQREKLPIAESDTENDCVEHTAKLNDNEKHQYFKQLTDQRIISVYGKLKPESEVIRSLCAQWPFTGRSEQQ